MECLFIKVFIVSVFYGYWSLFTKKGFKYSERPVSSVQLLPKLEINGTGIKWFFKTGGSIDQDYMPDKTGGFIDRVFPIICLTKLIHKVFVRL